MEVTVHLFASARDAAKCRELHLPLPQSATAADALAALLDRFPGLRPWEGVLRIAVNQEYAPGNRVLRDGDEVALIPPVSGG